MHPLRRKTTPDAHDERNGLADRLTDWLLRHCPFSTLAVLVMLVIGPTLPFAPKLIAVAVPVVAADLIFNLGRLVYRLRHSPHAGGHRLTA